MIDIAIEIILILVIVTSCIILMMRIGWLPKPLPSELLLVDVETQFDESGVTQEFDADLPESLNEEITEIVNRRWASDPIDYPEEFIVELERANLPD